MNTCLLVSKTEPPLFFHATVLHPFMLKNAPKGQKHTLGGKNLFMEDTGSSPYCTAV